MNRRQTQQKNAILHVLKASRSHPTADQIYEEVRRIVPKISKGTVYRNLRLLFEEGNVLELQFEDAACRYDGQTEAHYHFKCNKCGCVLDLEEAVDRELEKKVAARTGLVVTNHHTEFRGFCKNCRPQ